ncbi:LacI family DNA-binding transcriptional regulator [Roseburia hominis]
MASIREVAKLAGVSPSTVSRVMNGTARVDEEKKQRVLAAIDETGFKPNELARALYKKSSKIIGVIVPNIENPFFSELAKAVEEEAYRNGYRILLCNSNNNTEKEMLNIQMLNRMNADGIIIITNSDYTAQEITRFDLPVVVVDRKLKSSGEIAYIEANHYKGGKLAMEHLLECGCKNIVCMRGPQEYSSGFMRYRGYRDVCAQYDIKEQYIDCIYDYEAGLEAAKKLVHDYPNVDGILACNDMVAISVYKILDKEGYQIPDDVQLIGFDNVRSSWLMTPEITTIRQPITDMGTLATHIIMRYGNGLPFQKENIFDVSLVKRQTTRRKEK